MPLLTTQTGIVGLPSASNPVDAARWETTRQLVRLLEGDWEEDLLSFMQDHVDASRLASWGPPNQALNLFKSLVLQLACIYDEEPAVSNAALDEEGEAFVSRLGIWPRLQQHCIYVVGAYESAVRVEYSADAPDGIELRLVTADHIETESSPGVPALPRLVREARLRTIGRESRWCWDVFDLRGDPPSYRVVTADSRALDVTAEVLGDETASGPYPWVDAGEPYLPWVVYHAIDNGRMWSAGRWHELVQGTLAIALLWTFWMHAVKEASWDQKYAIDLVLQGLQSKGTGTAQRSKVTVDPTALLMFRSREGRGTVGSIGASLDPLAMAQAIIAYQQVVAMHLGVSVSDVTTTASPQSGIAISLSRDGLRKMQRRMFPQFRRGDQALLDIVAKVQANFAPPSMPRLPVGGWSVAHRALPLSREELDAALDRNLKLIEAGVRSRVDLLMEIEPGIYREAALEKLKQVRAEEAALASPATPATPTSTPLKPAAAGVAAPLPAGVAPTKIALAATDIASIVTVDEARASQGLPGIGGVDGALTVSEYQAKHASVVAAAANAAAGDVST